RQEHHGRREQCAAQDVRDAHIGPEQQPQHHEPDAEREQATDRQRMLPHGRVSSSSSAGELPPSSTACTYTSVSSRSAAARSEMRCSPPANTLTPIEAIASAAVGRIMSSGAPNRRSVRGSDAGCSSGVPQNTPDQILVIENSVNNPTARLAATAI